MQRRVCPHEFLSMETGICFIFYIYIYIYILYIENKKIPVLLYKLNFTCGAFPLIAHWMDKNSYGQTRLCTGRPNIISTKTVIAAEITDWCFLADEMPRKVLVREPNTFLKICCAPL